ncbi:BMA-ETR-1, isoform f [Aphelenchoides besseyi]|nr:BMA-ETR-1, isoform f [Aphelenchoides besseyi]
MTITHFDCYSFAEIMSQSDEDVKATTEPDSDTIKMFVGQIPRNWNEAECRELFEEFGPVFQLNVLRDKQTQASRGCCFVTFYHRQDAINAQDKLHNIRVLPQMNHAVQMKPADVENRNERKLFVGMLNKNMNEDDVRKMFKDFGQIEECTVLREDGKSRGCAFVTFVNRSCAVTAMKQTHQSQTLEGCSKPIVVKFADSQQKDRKQTNGTNSSAGSDSNDQSALLAQLLNQQQKRGAFPGNAALTTQLMGLNALLEQPGILNLIGTVITSLTSNAASNASPQSSSGITSQQKLQNSNNPSGDHSISPGTSNETPVPTAQMQLNAMLQQQNVAELLRQQNQQKDTAFNLSAYLPTSTQLASPSSFPGMSLSPSNVLQFNSIPSTTQMAHHSNVYNPSNAYDDALLAGKAGNSTLSSLAQLPSHLRSQLAGYGTVSPPPNQYNSQLNSSASIELLAQQQQAIAAAANSVVLNGQSKGPEGCNLFIYHLPQDYQDADLCHLFAPFGKIISAKVFIDKQTNLSKCFGFISYDNAISAQNAIAAMNGLQVNSKRLKVQLKRSKTAKPYTAPVSSANSGVTVPLFIMLKEFLLHYAVLPVT